MRFEKTYRRAIREIRKHSSRKQSNQLVPRLKKGGIWIMACGAVTFGLTVFMAGMPRKADARDFDRITSALTNTATYHMAFKYANGKVMTERWQEGLKIRYRFGEDRNLEIDRGFDGKHVWAIFPKKKTASIKTEVPWGFGSDEVPDISRIVESYKKYWKMSSDPEVQREGDNEVLTLDQPENKQRLRIVSEAIHHRPLKVEYLSKDKSGAWTTSSWEEFEYPEDIDDNVFAFHLPDGYTVYDYDKVLDEVRSGLEGKGQKATVGGITINVGCAVEDEYGGIHVLWSGGAPPPLFATAHAMGRNGELRPVEFIFEDDDRNRPRNHGIAPKQKPKAVPPGKAVITLRPLSYYQGKPFYAMRFRLDGASSWNSGVSPKDRAPVLPKTVRVTIPVCKPTAPYVQSPHKNWVKFKASGKQVGTVTFDLVCLPIEYLGRLVKWLDPEAMGITGGYNAAPVGPPVKKPVSK